MRCALYLSLLAGVAGCSTLPVGPGAASSPAGEVDTYGVRLIRPGMARSEVNALLGDSGTLVSYVGANVLSGNGIQYARFGLAMGYDWDDRLTGCGLAVRTESAAPLPYSDAELGRRLPARASPAEVQRSLGAPAAGYEREDGSVGLIYPEVGVCVVFAKQRLMKWHRYRSYDPGLEDNSVHIQVKEFD